MCILLGISSPLRGTKGLRSFLAILPPALGGDRTLWVERGGGGAGGCGSEWDHLALGPDCHVKSAKSRVFPGYPILPQEHEGHTSLRAVESIK